MIAQRINDKHSSWVLPAVLVINCLFVHEAPLTLTHGDVRVYTKLH